MLLFEEAEEEQRRILSERERIVGEKVIPSRSLLVTGRHVEAGGLSSLQSTRMNASAVMMVRSMRPELVTLNILIMIS